MSLSCLECNRNFEVNRSWQKYCSNLCKNRFNNKRFCKENKEFSASRQLKRHRTLYSTDGKYRHKMQIRALSYYHIKRLGECSNCSVKGKTQLHHTEYKVETVVELCSMCHKLKHEDRLCESERIERHNASQRKYVMKVRN